MMARYGITLGYQKDKCSICGYEKEIRVIFDNEDHKLAKICDACLNEHGAESIQHIIEEYGEKTDAKNIKILSKEQMEKSGFEMTGKKPIKKGGEDGKRKNKISG